MTPAPPPHLAPLFVPIRLGALELPHRIVMAPLTRSRAGTARVAGELQARHYAQRAGAGLIVSEGSQVSEQAIGYPGTPGIHTEAQVAGWRRVTAAVHAAGGRMACQLWHVGRASHPLYQPGGAPPVAPSPIAPTGELRTPEGPRPYPVPRELDEAGIAAIVGQFAHAARQARAAGFDGVEIHGANGYLIDQFLRDRSNQRTDRWGGGIAQRARFLLEVTDAVIAAWGADRVGVRLSPRGRARDMADRDPAATFGHAARELSRRGIAYLHVIEALAGPFHTPGERVTPVLRRAFDGPLMLNGGYEPAAAAAALAAGEGDLVSFGTLYIANPDLAERIREGVALAAPDPATYYAGDERGYTDYPPRATTTTGT